MVRLAPLPQDAGMSRRTIGSPRRRPIALAMVFGIFSTCICADHLFHSDIYPNFGAEQWARISMDHADLIALGEFVSVCDTEFGKSPLRDFRLLTAKFRIEELYKGTSETGTTVDIQVVGDMLVYPGETITRYQKRKEIRQDINDRKDTIRKRLDDINNRGVIESVQDNNDEEKLRAELAVLVRRSLDTPPRILAVLDQPSFYEVGGMIEPNVQYVIALWIEDDGSYLLAESYDRNIFWGEEAEQMADAFRSLTGR